MLFLLLLILVAIKLAEWIRIESFSLLVPLRCYIELEVVMRSKLRDQEIELFC